MKILVTGTKSFIGISLKRWLSHWTDKYSVSFVSLKNDEWKFEDFSVYDTLIHVAAVVHHKERPEMKDLYYKVNRDLTIEVALKAKQSGIKQFIFMSSMSVYGLEGEVSKNVIITKYTPTAPNTFYGRSKMEAELELNKIADNDFRVAIIRAPMIYGPNCSGNYARLEKLALKVPIFPLVNNQRSMLFIDNLCSFIRLLLENKDHGLFFPQNKEYVNTSELVRIIAKKNSKSIYFSKKLALCLGFLGKNVSIVNKIFGNLIYDKSLSHYKGLDYCVADLETSVKKSENK